MGFIDDIKFMFAPDSGQVIKYGSKSYYLPSLIGERLFDLSDVVLFSSVDLNDENNNVSWQTIKSGQLLGDVGSALPGDHWLVLKRDEGTFFVDTTYLDTHFLDADKVESIADVTAYQADVAANGGFVSKLLNNVVPGFSFLSGAVKYTIIGVVVLFFIWLYFTFFKRKRL